MSAAPADLWCRERLLILGIAQLSAVVARRPAFIPCAVYQSEPCRDPHLCAENMQCIRSAMNRADAGS